MEGLNVMFVSAEDFVDYKPFKAEILRELVIEKLTTAAREILAVVERTVSGYEEEAAGLRQEIVRQRSQMEAVLQPRESLYELDDEDLDICDISVNADEDESDNMEGEEQSVGEEDQKVTSPGYTYPRDPDYQIPKKRSSSMKKKRRKNEDISLRVCLLQDSNTTILKRGVSKSEILEVRCPRGLQEPEFLDLLRSFFPQLMGQFDALTTDTSRVLKPLNLKTLTPEKIQRAIQSRGKGRSALYIRIKDGTEPQSTPLKTDDPEPGEAQAGVSSGSSPVEEEEEEEEEEKPHRGQETEEEHGGRSGDIRAADSDGDDGDDGDKGLVESDLLYENAETKEATDLHEDPGAPSPSSVSVSVSVSEESEEEDKDEEWTPEEMQNLINKPHSSKMRQMNRSGVQMKKKKKKEMEEEEEELQSPSEVSTVESGAPLSCKVCKALKTSKNMLIKHSWSHVDDPEGLCGVCGEHSESPEELRSHLNAHRRTFSCIVCGKTFLSLVGLQRHTPLHSGERPFKCEVCGKAYASENTLKSHRWEHVRDKPFKCDVCQKSFAFKLQLRIHCRTHSDKKPYTCDKCGKSVSDLQSLYRHNMIHSGEKHFGCGVCGKRFVSPTGLRQHEKIHTVRDKTYLCEICCKSFHKQGQLKVHMTSHGEKKFICDICGKAVSAKSRLKAHMRIHTGEKPYVCLECGRRFNSCSHLREHRTSHSGLKPYLCTVCGKAWACRKHLVVHMRIHSGERPYKCTICDRAFTQGHCLKTHMKSHQVEEKPPAVGGQMD
ncbi:zinc finger protein 436-like [Xyrichtys novacula]|uniref:Zinc finger protein 436-like n=1 Tax=Xyrichtys novacula TaxID=13765 RepID=A0AAV1EHW4_XYRNO|nr:zinc finger protein 436-like [Xyrichtys novacula]